jgi:hypothetical protein
MYIIESYRIDAELVKSARGEVAVTDGEIPEVLDVRVPGTHGGFINVNGYYYSVDGMRESYTGWFLPYKKPVLLHHDKFDDPIGRVIDAAFVEDDPQFYVNRYGRTENLPQAHIDMILRITDSSAIKRILDGTYLTVSQGSSCDDVKCSICDQDIAKEGPCEHERWKTYDGKVAYWKFGPLKPREASIVNIPADEYAIMEPVQSSDGEAVCQPKPLDMKDGLAFITVKDEKQIREEKRMEIYDFSDWTAEDEEMAQKFEDHITGVTALVEGEDKTLTAEQRKKMKSNVFCGPNRSFPVNDCKHYSTAKAFLDRYKGPGDKSKIRACIERRGKALKCPTALKSKDEILKDASAEIKALLDEEFARADVFDQLLVQLTDLKGTISEHEKTIKEKDTEITSKDEKISEFETKITDFETKEKEHDESVRSHLAHRIVDIRMITGDYSIGDAEDPQKKYDERVTHLKERTVTSLTDTIEDLQSSVFKTSKLVPVTDPNIGEITDPITENKMRTYKNSRELTHFVIFGKPKKE